MLRLKLVPISTIMHYRVGAYKRIASPKHFSDFVILKPYELRHDMQYIIKSRELTCGVSRILSHTSLNMVLG